MLPISAIEGKGFHDLITIFLEPDYTMLRMTAMSPNYDSRAAASLPEILSLVEKVDSVDYESYVTFPFSLTGL